MCGIVGFVGKQSAAPILLKGLQQLECRGYDSAGIAVMDDDRIRVEKVSGRIARLCEKTEDGAAVPGTIALIDEGQPVIAVCCNEALCDKTLSNIVEVKARGAKVLALAFRGNRKIVSQTDDVIFIPRIETIFSAALAVVPLQLLAYYAAKEKGCDIDKPKNLAKSVTVE